MKQSFWDKILDKNLSLKDRSFRAILIFGAIASFLAMLEGFFMSPTFMSNFILILLFVTLCISMVLTFRLGKIQFSMILIGLILIAVVLPMVYINCGAEEGGAAIWLTMGIAYAFIFFSGKLLVFFTVLAVIMDVIAISIGYHFPELVSAKTTGYLSHIDILFSILAVGFFFGTILKFQSKVYDQERQIVLEQKEEIEIGNDEKMRFFSNMSQELKNPISNILELNELLSRENLSEDGIDNLMNLNHECKFLLSFVSDILDCAKLENENLALENEEYDTIEQITEIVDKFGNQAKSKNLDFVVKVNSHLPRRLVGDAKRIQQIVMNLLFAALQTTEKGSIGLEIGCEEIGEEWTEVIFKITDTGSGIRKDEIPYLFDAFKREALVRDSMAERHGISLTICKQLVDLMDGEITVDSIYTKGSTFTVTIEQKVADHEEVGVLNNYRKKEMGRYIYRHSFEAPEARILVVDDNEMNLMIFQKLLRETKVQIEVASSGTEALAKTYNRYYNIIFIDYMMPGMNGVETLSRIRRQENGMNRDTTIIALVKDELQGGEKTYVEMGFTSFLKKPVLGEKLENKILQYLPDDIVEYLRDTGVAENEIIKGATKMKRKLMITTDIVSDIPEDMAESLGIKLLHLYIRTPKGRFCDQTELVNNNYSLFRDDELLDTALDSASVEEYEEFFAQALLEADEIVHISLSNSAGQSYRNAVQAAKGYGHVKVIDSERISCAQGLMVIYASKLAKMGRTSEQIVEEVENIKNKTYASFVTKGPDQLYHMGYTSEFTKNMINLLGLRPKIDISTGCPRISGALSSDLENMYRKFVLSEFKRTNRINNSILLISHAGVSQKEIGRLIHEIRKRIRFEKVIVCPASASNTCGAGLGTFGFAYFIK